MPEDNPTSIADRFRPLPVRVVPLLVFVAAVAAGSLAMLQYAGLDLTLSHYDARAHLVVSRRITDSLTPGWRQIGAVWLPLPHLINMPVVAWDWAYRTGYPSAMLSTLALAAGLAALAGYLLRRTGSAVAALVAPTLVLANPNILYLQSTPMTEPLLLGLSFVALWCVDRWIELGTPRARHVAGAALMALALTRYEGWFVASGLAGWAAVSRLRFGVGALGLVPYLVAAIVSFLLLSYGSTGVWFVSSGFFEHDPSTYHQVWASARQVYLSTQALGGWVLMIGAATGLAVVLAQVLIGGPRAGLALALLAAAALPLYAFYQGHPHRVRYMVPVVAAAGVLAALAIAHLPRRLRAAGGVLMVVLVVRERPPLDPTAPMVTEAQWETPFRRGREHITGYLAGAHDGTPILASMGSLGHYMQEASRAGFGIADFVHEGNGDLWLAALAAPGRHVRWVLIEERAEGGDMLAARMRETPEYLAGFTRVAEGGGLALFRRSTP